MDASSFDRVVKMFGSSASRRGAIVTLVAGLVAPLLPDADAEAGRGNGNGNGKHKGGGKGKGKSQGHGKDRAGRHGKRRRPGQRQDTGQERVEAQAVCYGGATCAIGDRKYLVRCDLGRSTALKGKSCKGCNLTGANLRQTDATGANLSNANLSGVCLVDADLTAANLTGANTSGAIFCRTRMPNGSVNNSGCSKATSCCPTCVPIGESRCGLGGSCCGGAICQNNTCVCPESKPENCGGVCQECCAGADCPSGVCCQNACCAAGAVCHQNACCTPEPAATTCAGGKCGTVTNNCGQRVECGGCAARGCHDVTCTAQNTCSYTAHQNLAACESSGGAGICCGGSCERGICCAADDCPGESSDRCEGHACRCGSAAACTEPAETCCATSSGASCIDTSRDTANCGGCGERCRADVCQLATCLDGECGQRNAPDGPAADCPDPGCCRGACCTSGQVCFAAQCCTPLHVCPQGRCGVIDDGCGRTIDCGPCAERICKVGACDGDGVCQYDDAADRTACGAGAICCGGDCVSGVCCAAEDCPRRIGNRCAGHQCQCGADAACNGRDVVCCGEGDAAACEDLLNDPANCRSCGRVCPAAVCEVATCIAGACGTQLVDDAQAAGCAVEGQRCCDGSCFDLSTDAGHCGACGTVCPDHRPHCCGGICTDLDRDRSHCGGCGNACPPETCQAPVCAQGTCSLLPVDGRQFEGCDGPGQLCCDGACIDTTSDPQHCGTCDTVCPAAACQIATCTNGVCGVLPVDDQQPGGCELPEGGDGICCAGNCLECCGDDTSTCTGPIPVCHSRICDNGVCGTVPTSGESCGSGGVCCDGNCQACCGDDVSTCPAAAVCTSVTCNGGNCATRLLTGPTCPLGSESGVCCDGACQGCCGTDTTSCDDPATCQIVSCSTGICAYATAADGQQGAGCTGAGEFCCGGGACCTDGQVCAAGACCTPDDPAVTCAGKCGTVTNNCGRTVNCDGACVATGCQTATCNGTTCTIGTAANGTDPNNFCPGNQVCVNGACGCTDAATHCGSSQVCCNNQCVTGDCCAASECAAQTCRTKSCTNNQCTYSTAANGTDPGNRCLGSLVCVDGVCGCTADAQCQNGLGTCCNGTCCDFNQTCCGNVCCGSGETCCGNVCCGSGETCCGNVCCGSGQSCCNGVCKNTQTDILNCGSCGHRCGGIETCEGGTCRSDVNNCRVACTILP